MCKKIIGVLIVLSVVMSARASIMIYPKFIFFDDKTKSAEVLLMNGDLEKTANYRISLHYKRQNSDGSYVDITDPESLPADSAVSLLRYSPRSVELAPQQSQTVRLLKRLPEGLTPGDYIAYITFTEVLSEPPRRAETVQSKAVDIRITAIPAFSIPIFVRHAVTLPSVPGLEVGKLRYIDNKTYLPVRLVRKNSAMGSPATMIRGDISVWMKNRMLGQIKGKYLLPGTAGVNVNVPLSKIEGAWKEFKGKTLRVLFTSHSETEIDRNQILAETTVTL